MTTTYYEILNCSSNASFDELKQSYRSLLLKLHPDKALSTKHNSIASNAESLPAIDLVKEAWNVLSDEKQKKLYDLKLEKESKIIQSDLMYSEVDLDDMVLIDDTTFAFDCRCGNQFTITEQQLENEEDIVQCHGCTLCIKVLFQIEEDDCSENNDS